MNLVAVKEKIKTSIHFNNADNNYSVKNRNILKQWICQIAGSYNCSVAQIDFIFCSDDYLLQINRQFLNHNTLTDIITFDYSFSQKMKSASTIISGEIYISIDRVKENAVKFGNSMVQELHRVIIHGILHLCGLKDKLKDDQHKMRKAEDKALLTLEQLFIEYHQRVSSN